MVNMRLGPSFRPSAGHHPLVARFPHPEIVGVNPAPRGGDPIEEARSVDNKTTRRRNKGEATKTHVKGLEVICIQIQCLFCI